MAVSAVVVGFAGSYISLGGGTGLGFPSGVKTDISVINVFLFGPSITSVCRPSRVFLFETSTSGGNGASPIKTGLVEGFCNPTAEEPAWFVGS